MNPIVKRDILTVLRKTQQNILEKQYYILSQLSDRVIHNSSIFQDEDSVSIAVLVYSISKIAKQKNKVDKRILTYLSNAESFLSQRRIEDYHNMISKLFDIIKKDKKLSLYIRHVINKAGLKKGSKLYQHGISLGRASEIMGVSQWELMSYAGRFDIDEKYERVTVKERLDFAKKIFNIN